MPCESHATRERICCRQGTDEVTVVTREFIYMTHHEMLSDPKHKKRVHTTHLRQRKEGESSQQMPGELPDQVKRHTLPRHSNNETKTKTNKNKSSLAYHHKLRHTISQWRAARSNMIHGEEMHTIAKTEIDHTITIATRATRAERMEEKTTTTRGKYLFHGTAAITF